MWVDAYQTYHAAGATYDYNGNRWSPERGNAGDAVWGDHVGFFFGPKPGFSYTNSFTVYADAGSYEPGQNGVAWGISCNVYVAPNPVPDPFSAAFLGTAFLSIVGFRLRKRWARK